MLPWCSRAELAARCAVERRREAEEEKRKGRSDGSVQGGWWLVCCGPGKRVRDALVALARAQTTPGPRTALTNDGGSESHTVHNPPLLKPSSKPTGSVNVVCQPALGHSSARVGRNTAPLESTTWEAKAPSISVIGRTGGERERGGEQSRPDSSQKIVSFYIEKRLEPLFQVPTQFCNQKGN